VPQHPAKILVVDDDPEVCEAIAAVLAEEGFEVATSGNGAEALAQVAEFQPDLILCDVIMPVMSGYELLEKCRQDSSLALVPFIFLTAYGDRELWRQTMELGADDYLTKPIDRKELVGAITARLRKHRFLDALSNHKLETLRRSITLSLPHELRTPLSGILGLADLLVAEAPSLSPAEIAEIGQEISTCGERLHRLIQNFLLYAELEIADTQSSSGSDLTEKTP
jgi:CheY-like chemotaxis protein